MIFTCGRRRKTRPHIAISSWQSGSPHNPLEVEMGPEDYDDDEPDDGDDWDLNCHMMPDGQCSTAGSEDCEFECPHMAAQRAAIKRGGWYP